MALAPEQQILGSSPELQDVSRQRKLAEMLMSQGTQQPQGQMISGYYVAPSLTQQLNPLANILAGQAVGERADTKQTELATALRNKNAQDIQTYAELQKTDPARAIQFGLASQSPVLRNLVQEDLKTQKYGEGEIGQRRNIATGQLETVGRGGEKYRAPTSVDMGTMGTMLIYPDGRRETIQKGVQGPAGQVVERDDGTFLIDTRTGQSKPVLGPTGQPLMGGGKPLTETQSNAVAFGARAIEADKIVTNLEKQGVTNTGILRTVAGGIVSQAPIVGEKLEQGVRSAFNPIPSVLGGPSGEQQQVDQARRNFITAVLRKESGAVISPTEYKDEERKYFPQIGDTDKTITQKQEARRLAIKALEAQAGPSGTRQINKIVNEMGTSNTGEVVDFNQLPTGRR